MSRSPHWKILMLVAGFALWGAAFVVLYSTQAIGCGLEWHLRPLFGEVSLLRILLVALLAGFCLAGLALALKFQRMLQSARGEGESAAPAHFLDSVGTFAAYAAAVATLLTFMPILYASPCI